MSALQEAFERRNKKSNKIEELKKEQVAIEFINNFETVVKNGYENLTNAQSKHLLKCYGIYDKDDENEFVIRIRIPYGQLTLEQAKMFAKTSKEFGNSRIDLTTRSQVEFRHLKFKELPTVLANLQSVGITTYQTAGDNLRGIITSIFDGYATTSLIDCKDLVEDLHDVFLKNPDFIGTLPRKFNTGILGNTINDCNIYGHDCAFVLASKDEKLGFNLYLGGKVGVQSRPIDIFVEPHQVKEVFKNILELFKTFGFRDNRNKNRLTYFLDEVSTKEFTQALINTTTTTLQPAGTTLVKEEYLLDESSIYKLRDEKSGVYFPIPAGLFNSDDLEEVTALMEETNSVLRFTHEQSFFIITDDKNIQTIKDSKIFKKYEAYNNLFFRNQIACAGTNECSFGVIPNKSDSIEMAFYLNEHIPMEKGKIRMYWSACPKGCGVHGVADIGFEGAIAKDKDGIACDGVKIFLGGKATTKILEARQLSKAIPLKKAQEVVKNLIEIYKNERIDDETFENFDTRVLSNLTVEEIQSKIGL